MTDDTARHDASDDNSGSDEKPCPVVGNGASDTGLAPGTDRGTD